jgi:glycosyltransferase involved in cell wall biosynthesis
MRLLQAGSRGVSAARNLGWRAARYSLVAFLDADDLALPDRLQHQAAMFMADPDLQHVLCGWQRIDAQGRALAAVRPWEEGAGFSTREALRHKAVLPSAWMLRREALEAVGGFDVTLQQAEDVDLLLRLARSGHSGAWVPEVLCGYRVHEAAASRRARPQARALSLVVATDGLAGRPAAGRRGALRHPGLAGLVCLDLWRSPPCP